MNEHVTAASLPDSLAVLLKREKYAAAANVLHERYNEFAGHPDKNPVTEWTSLLGDLQIASEKITPYQRMLLYCIASRDVLPFYSSFLHPRRKPRRADPGKVGTDEEWNALYNHPFVVQFRDNFAQLDRESALALLKSAWDMGDKSGFVFALDSLTIFQNLQQRESEELKSRSSFAEDVASIPGLEVIVLTVPLGNPPGFETSLPSVRVIISNSDLPFDYSPKTDETEPTTWAAGQDDFWITTSAGTYTSLRGFLTAALKERSESIGHGPYLFTSTDDRNVATAANLIASVHHYLSVPSNFAANAHHRLKHQLDTIAKANLGPVYTHRYLRAGNDAPWVSALNFANGLTKAEAGPNPMAAARELALHGMTLAYEYLVENRWSTEDDQELSYLGFAEAMAVLLDEMKALSGEGAEQAAALARYEQEYGLHPDATHFPVEERSKLAFQDLSDIAVGNLTCNATAIAVYDEVPTVTAKVPFTRIAEAMVRAGDITNAMRLLEFDALSKNQTLSASVRKTLTDAGYFIFETMQTKEFGKIKFRALIDKDGEVYLRNSRKPKYRSIEQIAHDGDIVDGKIMELFTRNITAEPQFEAALLEQRDKASAFVARQALVNEITTRSNQLPAGERTFYIDRLQLQLPTLIAKLQESGVDHAETIVRDAIVEVQNQNRKPLFKRVINALAEVSGLMKPKL